jgi:ABC-2 type transport system permease protein
LFHREPRLGIVDRGSSEVSALARDIDGIEVTEYDSASELKDRVESNDLDAGLILQEGFDDALRSGERPPLDMVVGGESLASHRVVLAANVVGAVREVAGEPSEIDVAVDRIGDADYVPIEDRLIPLLVLFAVLIAGAFTPATSLVEEKEKGTLTAMLITPAGIGEVLLAKGTLGFLLAVSAGTMTLLLNDAFGGRAVALVLILSIAALMALLFGLTVGSLARDTNTLFSVLKGGNIILFAPAIFFVWPDLPQWIPKLLPTYYFLNPLYDVAVKGADLGDVAGELTVALAICALLVPLAYAAGRRMELRLARA